MKLSQVLTFTTTLAITSASLAADDARFGISLDGAQASAKAIEGGGIATATPKADTTPLRITFDRTGSDPIWQWLAASSQNGAVTKKLHAQAKSKPPAVYTDCLITQLTFSDLNAADGKTPMDATLTVVPKSIVAASAPPAAPSAKPKVWLKSNFRPAIGGQPLSGVSKVESFTIKQTIKEHDKPPVLALESARLTLNAADAKTLTSAIAKNPTQPFTIAFTDDDGSVWKTLSVTGLSVVSSQIGMPTSSVTIQGSQITLK